MNFVIYYMFVSNGLTLFVVCLNITVCLLFFVNCQICEKLIRSHLCVILMCIDLDVIIYIIYTYVGIMSLLLTRDDQ